MPILPYPTRSLGGRRLAGRAANDVGECLGERGERPALGRDDRVIAARLHGRGEGQGGRGDERLAVPVLHREPDGEGRDGIHRVQAGNRDRDSIIGGQPARPLKVETRLDASRIDKFSASTRAIP